MRQNNKQKNKQTNDWPCRWRSWPGSEQESSLLTPSGYRSMFKWHVGIFPSAANIQNTGLFKELNNYLVFNSFVGINNRYCKRRRRNSIILFNTHLHCVRWLLACGLGLLVLVSWDLVWNKLARIEYITTTASFLLEIVIALVLSPASMNKFFETKIMF